MISVYWHDTKEPKVLSSPYSPSLITFRATIWHIYDTGEGNGSQEWVMILTNQGTQRYTYKPCIMEGYLIQQHENFMRVSWEFVLQAIEIVCNIYIVNFKKYLYYFFHNNVFTLCVFFCLSNLACMAT